MWFQSIKLRTYEAERRERECIIDYVTHPRALPHALKHEKVIHRGKIGSDHILLAVEIKFKIFTREKHRKCEKNPVK